MREPTAEELERELVELRLELERIRRLQERYRQEARPAPRRRPQRRDDGCPPAVRPAAAKR